MWDIRRSVRSFVIEHAPNPEAIAEARFREAKRLGIQALGRDLQKVLENGGRRRLARRTAGVTFRHLPVWRTVARFALESSCGHAHNLIRDPIRLSLQRIICRSHNQLSLHDRRIDGDFRETVKSNR
jgi:hypothetical protein